MKLKPAGDSAILIELGNEISPDINSAVQSLNSSIMQARIKGLIETIPAFSSLLVIYDPWLITYNDICSEINSLKNNRIINKERHFIFTLPVCYGGILGEDLKALADYAELSEDEVIRRHSSVDYRIYMLGFLPGFAYLGGLDKSISCPRLTTPRQKILPGSVGIGGDQTGIYPISSPGGWRLIGSTPLKLYDPTKPDPIFYRPGDYIRFQPVSMTEYDNISRMVADGSYIISREEI